MCVGSRASGTRTGLPSCWPAARTHGVDAEGVGSQEDASDVGVQREQGVVGQELVTVATAGRVVKAVGTGQGGGDPGTVGTTAGLTSSRTGWPWRPRSSPRGR